MKAKRTEHIFAEVCHRSIPPRAVCKVVYDAVEMHAYYRNNRDYPYAVYIEHSILAGIHSPLHPQFRLDSDTYKSKE